MERTDKLDWVAAAGIAVAALILFLAIGRYAYAEDRVRCVESPGKGQWHSARVEGRRCWFKGRSGQYEASDLYWSAPEPMPITQPMLPPSEMEYRWHDQTGWSHNE
jgi:hypothetical protein